MSALLLLRAVTAASLLAVLHALRVERTADDLVADAGEVLHTAAAHEHDRVLLQVVADTGDVRGDLDLAGQPNTRDLAQRRVRLLRRRGVDTRADTAALGRALERRRLGLADLVLSALTDQLLNRGHRVQSSLQSCLAWQSSRVSDSRPGLTRGADPRSRACRPVRRPSRCEYRPRRLPVALARAHAKAWVPPGTSTQITERAPPWSKEVRSAPRAGLKL